MNWQLVTRSGIGRSPGGWACAIFSGTLVAVLANSVTDVLNPDWYSYASIFEEDGAYLAEEGRDPLFVGLMTTYRQFAGTDSYESFRAALGWMFILASLIMGYGNWFRTRQTRAGLGSIGLVLAITQFGLTRFTVQIREGIAMVCAVLALRHCARGGSTTVGTIGLAGATLVHGGAVIVLAGWLLGVAIASVQSGRKPAKFSRLKGTWLFFLVVGCGAGWLVLDTLNLGSTIADFYARDDQVKSGGALKSLYWFIVGVLAWLTASAADRAFSKERTAIANAVRVWSWTLLPAIYGLLIAEIASSQQLVVIATTSRALAIVTGLLLLLTALKKRLSVVLWGVCLFHILDQSRSIFEAIVGLDGLSAL